MRVLNLYAGIGGNRALWTGVDVTAVEHDPKIAAVYQKLYPQDTVIVGDAHSYLLENHGNFDGVWSSPPCQSHSRFTRSGRNRKPRYVDLALYEEILLLKHDFKGDWWVVENVVPFYTPLIEPTAKLGRHLFWSNFSIPERDFPSFPGFISRQNLEAKKEWHDYLGIYFDEVLYSGKNHCPTQVLRNAVYPPMGLWVFSHAILGAACGCQDTGTQVALDL